MSTIRPEDIFSPEQLESMSEINSIAEDIQQANEDDVPRLKESVFREVFLPFFAGDADRKYKAVAADWLRIAGTSRRPVDIVSDTSNDVLFRVPGFLDSEYINTTRRDDLPSLVHVAMTFQQLTDVSPPQGQQYLNAQMARRQMVEVKPEVVAKYFATWDAIFKRYGRAGFLPDKEIPTEPVSTPSSNAESILGYETF